MYEDTLEQACLELVCRGIKVKDSKGLNFYSEIKGLEVLSGVDFETFNKAYDKVDIEFNEKILRDTRYENAVDLSRMSISSLK